MPTLESRIAVLEDRMSVVEMEIRAYGLELSANTALTKQVHKNTEDIVSAVQWMAKFTIGVTWLAKFVAAPASAIVAVAAAIHLLK